MEYIHSNKNLQRGLGLLIGIIFGFLLHRGGVTNYNIILNQLLLEDFTVVRIMLSAVIVTMLGISFLLPRKIIKIQPKPGSIKNSIIGGLLFGVGFALLGYCPGTIAGAVGSGAMDGLFGGVLGIMIGSNFFASGYSQLADRKAILNDRFSEFSLFHRMKYHPLLYTCPIASVLIFILYLLH